MLHKLFSLLCVKYIFFWFYRSVRFGTKQCVRMCKDYVICREITIIAFSRTSRTHPNFVSAAGIEILDCKLAAPLSFCRGFGPRFCVHWAQNEARSYFGVFRSVRRIVVFLELVFTPMAIDKKKRSPSADWTELF